MKIFVKDAEETIPVVVENFSTIRDVKAKLEMLIDVPANTQQLIYNGYPLLDEQ